MQQGGRKKKGEKSMGTTISLEVVNRHKTVSLATGMVLVLGKETAKGQEILGMAQNTGSEWEAFGPSGSIGSFASCDDAIQHINQVATSNSNHFAVDGPYQNGHKAKKAPIGAIQNRRIVDMAKGGSFSWS